VRVVGVLDLVDGVAVHAVRGERERYQPVRGRLAPSADPLALARGFAAIGGREVYVADLDAIGGGALQAEAIAALAAETRVIVDAGATGADRVRDLLALGVARVVVGTETLDGVATLPALAAAAGPDGLVLSLDLRDRRAISRAPALDGRPALDALDALAAFAPREVIVLDLARVGSGGGPDVGLVAEVRARFPGLDVLAGGGVRDAADLDALARAGAAGALVGTALHTGAIGAAELRTLA
jgi:phosphoribosylformimino-5-aminoimidazole carboxamide ribotide isomerase